MCDHGVNLIFAGIADAHHGLLDQPCGIFADFDPRFRGVKQADAARLPQFQRGLRIGIDENFLDGRRTRPMLKDQVRQRRVKRQQPRGKRRLRVSLYLPVSDVAEAIAVHCDQPPASGAKAGVKPEQDQPSFSSTSSETS